MAKKNAWFKHYNEAHEGQTMSELWAEKDFETIAFYWSVLEMVSRWEDPENRGTWSGKLSIFRSKLKLKSQRSRKLLLKISSTFQVKVLLNSDESFTVSVPNWLELQENRGGKKEAKKEQKAPRGKRIEERGKNIDSEVVKTSQFELIFEAYPKRSGGHRKPDAFKKLSSLNKWDLELFTKAVVNYSKHCDANKKTGTQYVLQFASFCNEQWREWIDPPPDFQAEKQAFLFGAPSA